jgi:hypothetical protein
VTTSDDLGKLSPIGLGEFQLSRLNRAANSRKQLYEMLSSIIEDLSDARLVELMRDGRKSRMPELRRADEAQRIPAETEREIRRRSSLPVQNGDAFHHGLRADRGSGGRSQNGEFKGSRIAQPRRAAQRKGGSLMAEEAKQKRVGRRVERFFFVVTDRDGMMEKHYAGPDKSRAKLIVEKVLQARASAGGRDKDLPVLYFTAKRPSVFSANDLQLKLASGL